MGETINAYKILAGKLERKNHLEYLGLDETMKFKLILCKLGVRLWNGFIWLMIGSSGGLM
jgi:hypothetical protein